MAPSRESIVVLNIIASGMAKIIINKRRREISSVVRGGVTFINGVSIIGRLGSSGVKYQWRK